MKPTAVIARRPLVGLAAAFVAGTAVGLLGGHAPAVVAGWLAVAGVWIASRRVARLFRLQDALAVLLALVTGWLAAAGATDRRRADLAWVEACSRAEQTTVVGTVSGDVEARPLKRGGASYRFALRQVAVEAPGAAPRALGRMALGVVWYGPLPSAAAGTDGVLPACGERWRFTGDLQMRSGLLRKVRLTLGRVRQRDSVRLAPASLRDFGTLCDRARQVAARRLARGLEGWGAVPSLVQAMFLGTRSEIPRELGRVFRDSGTIHIFAISGMNVALLAVVLIAVLSVLGVPRTWWVVPLAPLLFFYTAVTGLSASALRACLMAVLYFGAPLLGRRPDGLSTLAAAAVVALAADPFQLQDAGFALSFVVMGGLLLVFPPLSEIFRRRLRVDDAALDAAAAGRQGGELAPAARRGYSLRVAGRRYLADLAAMSVAAWLASTPLTAWYFGRITPGSLLANLPIAPAAFFVGVASCVGLLTGLVSAWVGGVFNAAAGGLTQGMVWVAQATVAVPGLVWNVPPPALWQVGLWYAAILLFTRWLWRVARPPAAGAEWLEAVRDGR
jgi:competence protein ComEC